MAEAEVVRCEACGSEGPAQGRYCPSCGGRLVSDDMPTFSSPVRKPEGSEHESPRPSAPTPPASEHGRFVPGTLLAGRYRIVARLGRGGMGEVYRADDLTLGQPVALKFLPEAANADEEMLARFRSEVRLARRVSHPNVCRVYDVGDASGRHFLSMEYVDGEDLASLLRRIGRLPMDKAVEVAGRVCAGLAAAHAKGVLHRDLRPANVMLDSRGQVLITDFGLAALAGEVPKGDVASGTPAYMAPEQLDGREVTVQSDIYALGLVLYEIFTGRRAFEGRTLAEVRRSRSDPPSSPSQIVKDLDPAVERVILWCLETEPAQRPSSVLAVAQALPGGDPLAAALAAGQTPAPQVVADAGRTTGLAPRAALAGLAAAVLGLGLILALCIRTSGLDAVGSLPPETLAERARETLGRLGYAGSPADATAGFAYDEDLERELEQSPDARANWSAFLAGRPSLLIYWYRTSPRPLIPDGFRSDLLTPGIVTPNDPPATLSGMVNVVLDPQGRLQRFEALPAERQDPPAAAVAANWDPLFAAAALDPTGLTPAEPEWVSLAAFDARAAWTGTWPGTGIPLRVEAAAFQGKPVFFALIGSWTRPGRTESPSRPGEKARDVLMVAMLFPVLIGAALMARMNYVRARSDRRGALRLAAFVFAAGVTLWALRAHHVLALAMVGELTLAVAHSLFLAAVVWVVYQAIEPYVRRHWPQTIISWSRLMAGRLRDPLLGRDILMGVLLGLLWAVIFGAYLVVIRHLGATPMIGSTDYLLGGRRVVAAGLGHLVSSIEATLLFFFILFLLRVLLRRPALAAAAFVALLSATKLLGSTYPVAMAPTEIAVYAIAAIAVVRFGLVTLAAGIWTANLLLSVPVTRDPSTWYASGTAFAYLVVLGLAAYGFWTSLGGRRLWSDELFD